MRSVARLVSGLILLVVAVVLVVVVIAPYAFLPGLIERSVSDSLQRQLGTSAPPEVELDSDPQWRMLAGEFSDGRVGLEAVEIGGVRPDDLQIRLDPFDVNVIESFSSGSLLTETPISGQLEASFSEGTLTELAAASVGRYPVRDVALEEGFMVVESEIEVLGVVLPVSVRGVPDVESNTFVFAPEEVRAAGITVPDEVIRALLADSAFRQPLDELPYDIVMQDLRIENGRLVVLGDVPDVFGG